MATGPACPKLEVFMRLQNLIIAASALCVGLACGCAVETGADDQSPGVQPGERVGAAQSALIGNRPGVGPYNPPGTGYYGGGMYNPPGVGPYNPPGTGYGYGAGVYNPPGVGPYNPPGTGYGYGTGLYNPPGYNPPGV